jgi:hypothetical protein
MIELVGNFPDKICRCLFYNQRILYEGVIAFMPGTCCPFLTCNIYGKGGQEYLMAKTCERLFYILFQCGGYYRFKGSKTEFKELMKDYI